MNVVSDKGAEEAVLACCLISSPARKEARRHLSGADFFHPQHEAVWDAMSQLDRNQQPIDALTVQTTLAGNRAAIDAMLEVVTSQALADNVAHYATTVRSWAVRRRIWDEAARAQQAAMNTNVDAAGLASTVAARFAQVRDSGIVEDAQSITLDELLDSPDDEPDWVVPGLLERRDRMILTGGEGLGKSYLLRQIAIMSAGGLDPFDHSARIRPTQVLIVDCENSLQQVKRKSRAVVEFARRWGDGHAGRVNLLCTGRIDLLRDKDLSTIHREIDTIQPDIIVIGPIYAMSPRALMTDDDAVPVLAALDTMRDCGAALLMEAHAGHAVGADGRNFRPRGSAALMGWPEFGYGMKPVASEYVDLVPWRGDRDSRAWPRSLKYASDKIRWIENLGLPAETWSPSRGIA